MNLLEFIGNTPLFEIKIPPLPDGAPLPDGVRVFAKAEYFNPSGSVKDRAAKNILLRAIAEGALTKDKVILDSTSGNMGLSYAMIGAELGYKVELCLPADAGVGRKKALEAYGAKIIEIDPLEGPDGVYIAAISMLLKDPEKYFYPDQNNNDANWEAHYTGTAEEILKQTGGKVTHFLAGAGTSGTFTGVAKKLREHGAKSILMQPDSPFHGLEGVKHLESTIRPHFFDYGLADEIVTVSTEAAYAMTRRLAREAGMFVGVSSGANVRAALETAKKLPPGSLLVTVLCDDGNHYLTKPVWDEVWHISGERFNESVKKNRWSI